MSGPYDDIISLPHPTSKRHPRMPIRDRASIFSPFAALSGHGAAIAEIARLTEQRTELDEDTRAELDRRQAILLERGLTFGTVFLDCPKSRPLFYPQSLAIQGFCRNKLLVRFWTLKSKQLKIETEAAENLEFELLFPETELLLFPEKCVLILLWCLKVQSGMRAFLIIESNVFVNLLSQFSFRAVIIAIKLLLLEHSKEGFHHGVVVRRSRVGKRLRDF